MPCNTVKLPGGGYAIVCSSGNRPKRCSVCGGPGGKLCDFPLMGRLAGKTCDRPLCAKCATSGGAEIDYCPPHARMKGFAPK